MRRMERSRRRSSHAFRDPRHSYSVVHPVTPDSFDAWLAAPPWRPLVMGVLNVTPDSFSDGGRFDGPGGVERAADEAVAMAAAGADLIDVGGESTRPGSLPVPEAEQIRRVVPVLNAVRGD